MKPNLKEIIAFLKCDIHKINGYLTLKERITKTQLKNWVEDLFEDSDRLEEFERQLREIRDSAQDDFEHYKAEIKRLIENGESEDGLCGLRIARASKFTLIQFINKHLLEDSDQ